MMLSISAKHSKQLFLVLILILPAQWALAEGLELYVQPISSPAETVRAFKPLADYLSEKIGQPVQIRTASNFFAYWQKMRSGKGFDLALDAAHFTDYRVKRYGYVVLAKLPDTVSFSLVSRQDLLLFDAQDLLGHTVATATSPSMGGVRLTEIFSNPVRQPTVIQADNFQLALDKLRKGDIDAALVPTRLVSNDNSVNTIMTTKPVPHMALSASPRLSIKIRSAIRQALLEAARDAKGQSMLKTINSSNFEQANNAVYDGYSNLLSDVWGYDIVAK
ncbi:MAG: phosphate/phosphite/phosphonate ABC transporter substrate-binding protein [Gammaproteobacteria bacterium]|nr:phosphate/phosphite/phosphonate ABC transporter substrate-binding protein [Gammaproteobacteria bacterium]